MMLSQSAIIILLADFGSRVHWLRVVKRYYLGAGKDCRELFALSQEQLELIISSQLLYLNGDAFRKLLGNLRS